MSISVLQAILLGIVQGVTGWLPVSSSGHLVIFQQLFNIKAPLVFDVLLHFSTLLVIFVVFRNDITRIIKLKDNKLLLFIVLGSIPTGLIGYFFYDYFASFFSSLFIVGIALLLTGCLLYFADSRINRKDLKWYHSVFIGIVQGLSIIPGISRSGSTISSGLLFGLKKEDIVKFSFLLAVPTIIGATLYEGRHLVMSDLTLSYLVGMVVSFAVGYLSLKWLISLVMKKKFHYFAYYCWFVGVVMILIG